MRSLLLFTVVCAALLAACEFGGGAGDGTEASGGEDGPGAASDGHDRDEDAPPPLRPRVRPPAEDTVVLPAGDGSELAVATARSLYEEAPVVVLAADDDIGAQARAASVAVRIGAPMLLTPPAASADPTPEEDAEADPAVASEAGTATAQENPGAAVREELDRLGTSTVLAFDEATAAWADELGGDRSVVRGPTDAAELAGITGTPPAPPRTLAPGEVTGAVAELRRDGSLMLEVEDADQQGSDTSVDDSTSGPSPAANAAESDELGRHEAARPLDSLLALASPDDADVAATATARAAGARVIVTDERDPRADGRAITALAGRSPDAVVAFGDGFGDPDRLRDRIEVAATGVELPGGGQVVFPGRRMVALYGHPDTPALGVLGEQPLEDAIRRAEEVAADYEPLSDVPVIPTFEIISTIASSAAGSDGDYSDVTPVETLRPWVEAAGDAGMYVVLDLQPGRTDFLTQAQHYEELLTEPHVGLALDPEWRLGPDQVHLRQIGSVDAEEVNTVITWLADLTREHRLPQKVLVLHQFRLSMITNRGEIDTSRDELAVLIHADGHGTPSLKYETWDGLTASPPPDVFWGWKNFYDEDAPMMSPAETLEVEPSPLFVSYQ